MPPKISYEAAKDYIENAGDKLISNEYINNKVLLVIECGNCGYDYDQNYARYSRGYRHKDCPDAPDRQKSLAVRNATRTITYITKVCVACDKEFTVAKIRKNQIVCSQECLKLLYKKKSEAGYFKRIGSIGGKVSAAVQTRRSQNEILFANLCYKWFIYDDIVCNEPMFNGWDADVVLKKLKIAILWNGIWHYKKVRQDHNLEHVQHRDQLKKHIIEKMGFIPYIIKDMGGYNKQFVISEFKKLRNFVYFI